MNFVNKTVLVTGSSNGIGKETIIEFAKLGYNVIINYNNDKDSATKLQESINKYNVKSLVIKCDISNESEVQKMINTIINEFGKIDILINNAALWRDRATFVDSPVELWQKYIDINIMGVVYCTKAVLPKMIENKYGKIINIASVAGVYGNAKMTHYSTTKGALIAMTKALAKEVVNDGVIVNAVSPGSVSPADNPDMNFYRETPLSHIGRTGTDMENANLICFLASDDASYIIGQNIQIDGCRKKL